MNNIVQAFGAYVDAWDTYQADMNATTAKALLAAADALGAFARDDLPIWPYDGVRHQTLLQMDADGRALAGIGPDDNW